MFSVINKHLAGGESTKKMRRKKSGKRAKSAGKRSRIQSDGKGGITLGKKRSKNISIAKLRKRKGASGGENPKKKQKLQFQPGQKVRLSHPSFQGKLAIVDKYLERKQKYGLRVIGLGKKISLAMEHLTVVAKKKKTAAKALGGFTKTITQDAQPAAETTSGARVTFSGGQITLNKSAKAKGKAKANRKRKQAGGLAAKALTGITLTTAADGGREAKRAKTASAATRQAPTVIKPKVVKTRAFFQVVKKKKPKKKLKPKKAGLGPQIDHYQAKGGALVLVRNLPKSVAGHHLIMDLFPDAGEILSSIVHTDAKGKTTGSGEVHFARLRDAQKAIADMRGTVYGGNKISMTLIGTQQGGRMTSEVQVEKQEIDSEDEYESEYEEDEPQEEEEKLEPTAEPEAEQTQSGEEGEPEEEEDEEDEDDEAEAEEEAPEESAAEESASEAAPPAAGGGGLDYIEPSDSEEEEGPEFHVTLKGGLGLQG